jgi:co-chaperonin GroES (HSP10)
MPGRTAGGIIIPPTAHHGTHEAIVIGIGPDVKLPISIGDRVIVNQYEGWILHDEDEELHLVEDFDLQAIVLE